MKSNKWRAWLPAALLLCLGVSLLLNIILFERANTYYLQLNGTRLDPLGLQTYDTHMPPHTDQIQFVFFGDSRAAEWPSPPVDGFSFHNRGIGAQTSTQTAARFEQHIVPLQPDIVLLQIGINDLKTIPLFPDQRAEIVANCQRNIEQMVADATAIGTTVIVSTIFPVGEPPLLRRPYWSDEITVAVDEVNAFIHALAAPNVLVFDAYAILAGEDGLVQPEYVRDELHLNEQGYEALNQSLQAVLESSINIP
jgi:lysophospholipase L1-like esterase